MSVQEGVEPSTNESPLGRARPISKGRTGPPSLQGPESRRQSPPTRAVANEGARVEHDEAIRVIQAVTTAFDEHDLDGIMAHFADDAVFEAPRGPDPWGQRFVGPDEVRAAFAGRFSGI